MKRRIAALLVGSAVAMAGCGGGETSAPDSAGASTPAATTTPVPSGDSAGAVAIKGFAFAPGTIRAKVGEKITWTNEDSAAHTATAESGADFDSGDLAQGASFSFTPQKAGTISYLCTIHPSMIGTIEVSE